MNHSIDLLVFTLDEQQYAIRLVVVERVVRAVAVTPLPNAPAAVCGVVNVQGVLLPVANLRLRLGLAPRPIDLSDQFIIAGTARRRVVLISDAVAGVFKIASQEITNIDQIAPGLPALQAVAKLGADMLFIYDLDTFLSVEEEMTLHDALETTQG